MYHALSILKLWCASWSKVFLNLWVVLMQMKIDPWMASFLRWLTGIRNWLRKLKGMDCQGNMQEWRTKNDYFLPSPGAYIRMGNLMEGFLYLEFEGLIIGILCKLDWKRSSQWLDASEGLLISPSQDFSRQNDLFQSFGMLLLGSNRFLIYENTIVSFFRSFYFIQMKCPISGEHWIPPNWMLVTNLRLHLHLISWKVFIIALDTKFFLLQHGLVPLALLVHLCLVPCPVS